MKFSAIAAPQTQLALPAPPTAKGQGKRSKGKNGKGKGEANKGSGPAFSTKVDQILANAEYNRQFFHKTSNKTGICYNFQKGQCTANPCPVSRDHVCLGCGKPNVQYESCRCIDNVVVV